MQAWLDTPREKAKECRRESWVNGEPDAGPLEYIGQMLYEVGPIKRCAYGLEPIGWQDIAGWMDATGEQLEPWEAIALADTASTYYVQAANSTGTDALAPWIDSSKINHNAMAERARRRHKK